MQSLKEWARLALTLVCACSMGSAWAAEYPTPREASWVARDFRVHTGEVMPQLQLNYRTIGAPTGRAGPRAARHGRLGRQHAHAGFRGRALRSRDSRSTPPATTSSFPTRSATASRPSPRTACARSFPKYNYDDMVDAHYRLLTEHLNVRHVRAVIGNSMGGMETWIFAVKYPDYMDIAVPMACLPTEMSSRNWMLRRLITDSIRNDPDWKDGQYTQQPRSAQCRVGVLRHRDQRRQPGAVQGGADAGEGRPAARSARLAAPFPADANDVLYQWDSSRDYNPSAGLEKIKATVLAINAADDERNPAELGVLDREIKRVKNGRVLLIPASENTAGHGTTGMAKFYQRELAELLQSAPRSSP